MHKTICVGRSANIQNSCALRSDIVSALDDCHSLTLDVNQLQEIDISFLQTAYSARVYAASLGKRLSFTEISNESVAAALHEAGLADLLPSTDLNHWLHGRISQ